MIQKGILLALALSLAAHAGVADSARIAEIFDSVAANLGTIQSYTADATIGEYSG